MTRPARRAIGLAAITLVSSSLTVTASTPTFWKVASQADFLKGELRNLAIDTDGRLTLGPTVSLAGDAAGPMVWEILVGADGAVLAGTGNDGKVLRIAPNGTLSTAFDAAELQVHALAAGRDGAFFAGTSPDGKVYRVARDGTASDYFDPEDKYIWALAAAPDGTIYVGTGEKGTVYRVTGDGKAQPFYKTRATNVTSLALDPAGNLLVGTSGPGQVLRIDKDGRGFVLLDTGFPEVSALRFAPGGVLYAVSTSGEAADAAPAPKPAPEPTTTAAVVPTVSTEITITAIGDVPTGAPATPPQGARADSRRGRPRGAIYRIEPDGLWEIFWEATDEVPYDVLVDDDRSLFVATGNKGHLLHLSGNPTRVTLIARAEAQQITALASGPSEQVHFATANPGKVFRVGTGAPVVQGTYESDVRDATNVASWGSIQWRAVVPEGGSVELFTRTGNTKTPDETWSQWSPAYSKSDGQPVVSPKARYLQWRAVLKRQDGHGGSRRQPVSPVLTSVSVAYLPRNTRPSIESITVHPPGVAFARPFPTGDPEVAGYESGTAEARPQQPAAAAATIPGATGPATGRRLYQKGLQTFVWKANDEPDDRLQYDVFYRRQGETTWTPLRRALWDPIVTWDTTSVADGTYTIRVVATDAASNAPGRALTGDRESDTFEVDNTAPAVTVTGARQVQGRTVVNFTVSDNHSPLERVEFSLDATRWQPAYPVDGIPDGKEERFEVTVENTSAAAGVTIRAVDTLNNVGTTTLNVPATKR